MDLGWFFCVKFLHHLNLRLRRMKQHYVEKAFALGGLGVLLCIPLALLVRCKKGNVTFPSLKREELVPILRELGKGVLALPKTPFTSAMLSTSACGIVHSSRFARVMQEGKRDVPFP